MKFYHFPLFQSGPIFGGQARVTIVNIEGISPNATRWLLDGRQRRNALTLMSEDPERIYFWARSYIGFKNMDQLNVLEAKFWEKVNEYIEVDELSPDSKDDKEQELESENDNELGEFQQEDELNGLDLLLSILKICHNNVARGTGLTRPFDFSDFFSNTLQYVQNTETGKRLNSRKLKIFFSEYINFCKGESISEKKQESFVKFLESRMIPKNENSMLLFRETIKRNWKILLERIEMFDNIDKILRTAEIGLIEVSNIKTTDAQKIFNIINTGGSLLTSAEILSAKPAWNIKVKNPSPEVVEKKDELYRIIGTEVEGVVRWDLVATFVSRINDEGLLFPIFTDDAIEKKLSLGFKILAGQFQGGVKKDDVDKLSSNEVIINPVLLGNYLVNLNQMIKVIGNSSFFSFVKSWKKSIMSLLSDAIMLNFLLILYKDYERKGFPVANTDAKKFQKNAIILFDKMVYEYSRRSWRGSSDSTISKNLASFSATPELFEPISEEKWDLLLNEIFEKCEIEGSIITDQGALTPILYHHYYLSSIQGPNSCTEIEVDHIYPKALFEVSTIPNKELIMNNLYNLELLPKRENISKSNKRLEEVTNSWLISQIFMFSGVAESDFKKYSDLGNHQQLKLMRSKLFKKSYKEMRNEILNN